MKESEPFTQTTRHFSPLDNPSGMHSFRATRMITCLSSSVLTDRRKSSEMVDGYTVTGHMKSSLPSTSTHQTVSNGAMQRGTSG